jgi:cell pole-organizing protein PopZ
MSAAEAQTEPTMEEILASIRRIISEDDAPKADAVEESPDEVLELQQSDEPVFDTAPEPMSESVAETVSPDFDFDALPLDDDFAEIAVEEPVVAFDEPDEIIAVDREPEPEPLVEFDAISEPEPEPEPLFEESAPPPIFIQESEPAPAPQSVYQPKIIPPQLEKTIGLIGADAANAASEAFAKLGPAMPGHFASGPSVEELVAYLLKPMLKDWLDKNLPRIVEERVEAELARIARRGF